MTHGYQRQNQIHRVKVNFVKAVMIFFSRTILIDYHRSDDDDVNANDVDVWTNPSAGVNPRYDVHWLKPVPVQEWN